MKKKTIAKLLNWGGFFGGVVLTGVTAWNVDNLPPIDLKLFSKSPPRYPLPILKETYPDRDFSAFRDRLKQAVQERDDRFLKSIAAPDIRLHWTQSRTLDDINLDPDVRLWLKLEKLLALDCIKPPISDLMLQSFEAQSEMRICPGLFDSWRELGLDPYRYVAIVGENVNVHKKSNDRSPTIATLSNEAVKLGKLDRDPRWEKLDRWTPIVLPDGKRGYVRNRYVYSPADYRVVFIKVNGQWQMESLLTDISRFRFKKKKSSP
jgi:hypothetical protein